MTNANQMIENFKQEEMFKRDEYISKFLKPHQYSIKDSNAGFDVNLTFIPKAGFSPARAVSSIYSVNVRKVKSI
jgi:hypothetical protein